MRRRLLTGCLGAAFFSAGVLPLASPPASAQARPSAQPPASHVTYAYTRLDLEKCQFVRSDAEEDYGYWNCTGYGGIPIWVGGGDLRSYVSFGRRARDEPAAQETLASFNSHGRTIEWRLARNAEGKVVPFATILRWSTTITADTGEPADGQVLVITRLGPGAVCHVGYVDGRANPDANALARKIADESARSFNCRTDKRIILGQRGPGFSERYGPE